MFFFDPYLLEQSRKRARRAELDRKQREIQQDAWAVVMSNLAKCKPENYKPPRRQEGGMTKYLNYVVGGVNPTKEWPSRVEAEEEARRLANCMGKPVLTCMIVSRSRRTEKRTFALETISDATGAVTGEIVSPAPKSPEAGDSVLYAANMNERRMQFGAWRGFDTKRGVVGGEE